jgi:hypothetical protein
VHSVLTQWSKLPAIWANSELSPLQGENQALEMWVSGPDPVACHQLSCIKMNKAETEISDPTTNLL